jgi:(S)-2-hydroxy-acid oxidase
MHNFKTLSQASQLAKKKIKYPAYKWLEGAAEHGFTYKRNREIFRDIGIIPRVLVQNHKLELNKDFFNQKCSIPIIIPPMGGIDQFSKNIEYKLLEAAEKNKIPYFFPNNSGHTIKQLIKKKNFNFLNRALYLDDNINDIKEQIEEAEKNKCNTICITVDAPIRSISYDKIEYNYDARKYYYKQPLNYSRNKTAKKPITWKTISIIKKFLKKPLILKGILSKKDAITAYNLGADAIWISNHGGRVLETDVTSIEVLTEIRASLPKRILIICDGGIRTGTDILKTISLGADFVAIGRPFIHGIISDSINGIENVISILKNEISTSMILAGTKNFKEVNKLKKIIRFKYENR